MEHRAFRSIEICENRIVFPADYKPGCLNDFLSAVWHLEDEGTKNVCLDFSQCTRSFPNQMVPTILIADWFREDGVTISIRAPSDDRCFRLFESTNWLYLLDPSKFRQSDYLGDRHLAASRFRDEREQASLVREVIDRAISEIRMSSDEVDALRWTINEISGNVLDHADSKCGGILQLANLPDRLAFCVGDLGRGIRKSFQNHSGLFRSDVEAIEHASKRGVTRDPDIGQGNGLAGSLALAAAFDGQISICSHKGQVRWEASDAHIHRIELANVFPGTFVDMQMRKGVEADISLAISGEPNSSYRPHSVYEDDFVTDDSEFIIINVSEQDLGFGTRPAGRQLRTKCLNLVECGSSRRVKLDWSGVPIVASSYADELVGKLFVHLGPTRFSSRVQMVGMNSTVKSIIDRAIMQRVSQSFTSQR